MPSLVRKLLIFATVDGLILQAHGQTEHHNNLKFDFQSKRLSECSKTSFSHVDKSPRLEVYGIIGQIHLASVSYLIAITKREQVAQIFGKPVYTIKDVAILPITTNQEADQAIIAAVSGLGTGDDLSDSDSMESDEENSTIAPTDAPSSPSEDPRPFQQENNSSTSIAEDVATRKLPFGRFASQWLSKRSIAMVKRSSISENATPNALDTPQAENAEQSGGPTEAAATNLESKQTSADKQDIQGQQQQSTSTPATALVPKVLRGTKMLLSSGCYFFSYDVDLTRRFTSAQNRPSTPNTSSLNSTYFWNRRMGGVFIDSQRDAFLMPIIQGFVGQRLFSVKPKAQVAHDEPVQTAVSVGKENNIGSNDHTFLLTLISRRSTKRSGLRYLRRGIDDDGNCANFVETEQILSKPSWLSTETIRSFVQVRGSIPLYFSQSPYSFKPAVTFHNTAQANEKAFKKHFNELKRQYGDIEIAMLIDKHGPELPIGNAYQRLYNETKEKGQLDRVDLEWFDFHKECRGMKFENVQRLVTKLQGRLNAWGETVIKDGLLTRSQRGVIRTNCMDCLDRTNVAESAFAQYRLQIDLEEEGYDIDLVHDESTNWFNTLWADNGDAISRLYAGTAALKGDYTRTRRRDWRGAINDFGLTLTRYYGNMVNDYFSQAVIDLLLYNVSWKVFEDFESTMMSADPGISVESGRQAVIENCVKIVVQEKDEELVHGWTMLVPAQENTLRTLPFEEAVILLTDAAIYCCRLDWTTEKIARYERIDLRSIVTIRHGTFVTSTFTDAQMDEEQNQGVLIIFKSSKSDMIRVNTRSLQSAAESGHPTHVDGGTGLMSWLTPRQEDNRERTMAFKVMPSMADEKDGRWKGEFSTPRQTVESICAEIRRAIVGSAHTSDNLVEAEDIISASEAKKRTGYLEQLGHSIKRFVWT